MSPWEDKEEAGGESGGNSMVIPFVLDVEPVSRSLRSPGTWAGPHCWVTEMGACPAARRGCPPLFVLSADVQTCDTRPQSRHPRGGSQGWAPSGLVSSLPVSPLLFLPLPTTSLSPSHPSCLDFYPRLLVL